MVVVRAFFTLQSADRTASALGRGVPDGVG